MPATNQPNDLLKCWMQEFRKLKLQGDRAVAQVRPDDLFRTLDEDSNCIAVLMKHLAGNIRSRWTGFLTMDGEKPDRNRDSEFLLEDTDTPESVKQRWEAGWKLLLESLETLREVDLGRSVIVRGESQTVPEAIFRQMSHYASHVGQIVLLAKHFAGSRWQTLSVPRGQSEEYNAAMRQKWSRP